MALTALGELSYNGFTFSALCKSKVSWEPVQDESRRTTAYVRYKINVTDVIKGGNTDAQMADIRKRLTAQGGALKYSGNRGLGSLEVNVGDVRDVMWGPICSLSSYTPAGGALACIFDWECTTCIPECDSAKYTPPNILAANYEVNYTVKDGLTTVTMSGYVQIPMTRASQDDRSLKNTADDVWEQIVSKVTTGFRRVSASRTIEKAKNILRFTIVDEELLYPLPDGTIRCDITHRVASNTTARGGCLLNWNSSLSGTIATAPGEPKGSGWDKFIIILADRIGDARAVLGDKNVLIHSLDVEENLFENSTRFNVSYYLMTATINNFMQASGLWSPVPGTDFTKWSTSLENTAFHPRGSARLKLNPNDDAIVDLCGGKTSTIKTTPPPPPPPRPPPRESIIRTKPGPLNPAASWLYFNNTLRYSEDDRVARHKPMTGALKTSELKTGSAPSALDGFNKMSSETAGPMPGFASATIDNIQRVSAPSYSFSLEGEAIRVGYQIQAPGLDTVGGIALTQQYKEFECSAISQVGGIPIYYARWLIDYICPDDPSNIPIPSNPWLQTGPVQGVLTSQ